jgi:4-hydroxy-4-methyl-2-oxoglutarate aldolase
MQVSLVAAALSELGAATLGESGGRPMQPRIRPVWLGATLAAPALPVVCTPGDNLAVHAAVASAPEGVALVVSVGEERELGYWGEVLTTAAQSRSVQGLVIDGCVRDVAALAQHKFPVFSTGIALPGATKTNPGSVGAVTWVGGVDVHAGDWIVGDTDGVTVVPSANLEAIIESGKARAAKEDRFFTDLRAGRTTVDLLGLDTSPIEHK